jgi:DNA-binding transcriptional regulator YdaS (Cro superfamily)
MDLKSYISDLERGGAAELAEALGVSPSYLSQMAAGTTAISPARAVLIEQATAGAVTRKDLRPDDWKQIWPELAAA